MKKEAVIIFVAIAMVFFSLSVQASAEGKVIKWTMQASYPLSTGVMMHGVEWAKHIEKLTNGRLKIQIFPPGAICDVQDLVTYLEKDVFDCAISYGGYYTGLIPETDFEIGLPMGHQTWDEYWDAYWNRGLGDVIREAYAEHNIRQYPCAADCYYHFNTNYPVTKLEDLKGKKIRALGVYGKYVQALGGSPVVISGSELYMAMKLGVIDGAILGTTALQDIKFHEVVDYYTFPTAAQTTLSMLINQKSLDKLPEDLRIIVDNGTRFILEDTGNQYITRTKRSLNKSVTMGSVTKCYLPEAELIKAKKLVLPIWDELSAKSPRMKKGVEILKQQMRDLGRPMN